MGIVKYILDNKICHPVTHGLETTIPLSIKSIGNMNFADCPCFCIILIETFWNSKMFETWIYFLFLLVCGSPCYRSGWLNNLFAYREINYFVYTNISRKTSIHFACWPKWENVRKTFLLWLKSVLLFSKFKQILL